MLRSRNAGVGSALPRTCVPNTELEDKLETSDAWIRQRTGIGQRYIAKDDETSASLGEAAARAALEDAGMTPDDIDLIIDAPRRRI